MQEDFLWNNIDADLEDFDDMFNWKRERSLQRSFVRKVERERVQELGF